MNLPHLRFKEFNGEWNKVEIQDFFQFIDGDRGKNYPNEKDFKQSGYCLFLNAHNISETGLIFENSNWISKEKHLSLRKGTAEYGDLILTTRGSKLGKIALYDESVPYSVVRINSAMLLIRKKCEISLDFSLYLFKEKILPNFISRNIVGSAQPHVTVKDLKKIKIGIPLNFNEQKKIGTFFSLIDSKIEKQQEKINLLKAQKKGYMQRIFKQEIRFKDENGEEYPEWKTFELNKLGTFGKSYSFSRAVEGKGIYSYIHYGDIHSNYPTVCEDIQFPTIMEVLDYELVCENDIIFADASEDYADLGKAILVRNTLNQHIIAGLHTHKFTPNEKLNSLYFIYYTQSRYYEKFIKRMGTGVSVLGISKTNLNKLEVPLPSIEEQQKIGQTLYLLDQKIRHEGNKIKLMEERKQGFMQKMFI